MGQIKLARDCPLDQLLDALVAKILVGGSQVVELGDAPAFFAGVGHWHWCR